MWFQEQLEQIWAHSAVERGSPARTPASAWLGTHQGLGEAALLSCRVATNRLRLIAKSRSEIATKSGIYLAGLHAAFDNTSTVGYRDRLGFFFS